MIVVIDNYDSFTFNLVQILLKNRLEVRVFKNDEIDLRRLQKLNAQISGFLFSPGPGHASEATLCHQILASGSFAQPILGVCLGHQVIAEHFSCSLRLSQRIHHGRVSQIRHEYQGLFKNLPNPLKVVRYHSWTIDEEKGWPKELKVLARSQDGEIMALQHVLRPWVGLQFHPESILTEHGEEMVMNFFKDLKAEQ